MVAFRLFSVTLQSKAILTCLFLYFMTGSTYAQNQEVPGCGRLGENYEGYAMDYYKASKFDRQRVEGPHFNDEHAALSKGSTVINNRHAQGPVAGGLDYVLRVWPNHPGALADMSKYARIKKSENPDQLKLPVKCYFKRAIVFTPDDSTVRFLYAIHLLDFGYEKEASEQLEMSIKLNDQPNINTRYNMGLLYFRLKRYDEARLIAEDVYSQGYELQGLRNLLQRAGKW